MPATKRKKSGARSAASKTLHVAFVWDMSGSMGSVWNASIEGFNEYVRQLQEDEDADTTRFTLTVFDTVFEDWFTDVPVTEMPVITRDRYIPRGNTALYDAIANTIQRLDTHIEGSRDEKVLVVVLTDGHENASVEYNALRDGRNRLAQLVQAYTDRGNWSFVYLGANDPDVAATASSIGVPAASAAYYSSDHDSVTRSFAAVSTATLGRKAGSSLRSSEVFADAGLGTDYRSPESEAKPEPRSGKVLRGSIDDLFGGSK